MMGKGDVNGANEAISHAEELEDNMSRRRTTQVTRPAGAPLEQQNGLMLKVQGWIELDHEREAQE